MRKKKQLVLFDIDGTLVYPVSKNFKGRDKFIHAVKKIWGKDIRINEWLWHGWIDRQILVELVRPFGISPQEVHIHMPEIVDAFIEKKEQAAKEERLFEMIPESNTLLEQLIARDHITIGVLTGNIEKNADWKLKHAGIKHQFSFGLYGNEAESRIDLAKMVFERVEKKFGDTFLPEEIIVIGDTVQDIICARAIGAKVIITTSKTKVPENDLIKEKPDLLVKHLTDQRVMDFFKL